MNPRGSDFHWKRFWALVGAVAAVLTIWAFFLPTARDLFVPSSSNEDDQVQVAASSDPDDTASEPPREEPSESPSPSPSPTATPSSSPTQTPGAGPGAEAPGVDGGGSDPPDDAPRDDQLEPEQGRHAGTVIDINIITDFQNGKVDTDTYNTTRTFNAYAEVIDDYGSLRNNDKCTIRLEAYMGGDRIYNSAGSCSTSFTVNTRPYSPGQLRLVFTVTTGWEATATAEKTVAIV